MLFPPCFLRCYFQGFIGRRGLISKLVLVAHRNQHFGFFCLNNYGDKLCFYVACDVACSVAHGVAWFVALGVAWWWLCALWRGASRGVCCGESC